MSFIDTFIIILFIVLTFYVGLRAASKVHSTNDFAVGGKSYGTFAILATLSASYIGGGYTFGLSEKVFTYGITYILALLGFSIQQILVATLIAPKMARFKSSISVGDMMGHLYGKHARTITAICSFLVCTGIIGAQINAMGYVFNLFLDLPIIYGILIGTTIVVIYAAVGGMCSVVATDILQFIVLIIILPLTFIISLMKLLEQDSATLLSKIEPFHLSFNHEMGLTLIISLFLSLLLGETLVPPYVQRLLIGKTVKETARGTLISAIISIPFFVLVGLIGVVAYIYSPDLNPNLALPFVIDIMLPIGLKGLAVAAIISVIMSTADSYLNAASVALVHDLYKPLSHDKLSPQNELKWMRIITIIIGALATIFALTIESVLDILLYSYNFWAPLILTPLVFGIVKKYTLSSKQFVSLTCLTAFFMLIWSFILESYVSFDGLVAGVGFNLMLYLIMVKYNHSLEISTERS